MAHEQLHRVVVWSDPYPDHTRLEGYCTWLPSGPWKGPAAHGHCQKLTNRRGFPERPGRGRLDCYDRCSDTHLRLVLDGTGRGEVVGVLWSNRRMRVLTRTLTIRSGRSVASCQIVGAHAHHAHHVALGVESTVGCGWIVVVPTVPRLIHWVDLQRENELERWMGSGRW